MKGKRTLITGGAGLVGSHIADLLVEEDAAEVRIFDDLSRGCMENLEWALGHGPVHVIEADVRDRKALAAATADVDVVFHQAAIRITRCADEPRLALEVLGEGTFNVLEASRDAGVSKVVAASSASIYGLAERFPTPEEHHGYDNRTLYGTLKTFNEGLLRCFHDMYGLDYVALRYFNIYGPRMDVFGVYTEVLIRWIERIEAGERPLIFGDGHQSMDFVHVRDVARANLLAATSEATDVVLNVASGEETTLRQLATLLLSVMDSSLVPEHREERKVNAVRRRQGDVERARRLLGFETSIGLRQGLEELVPWVRQRRAALRS